MPSFTPGVVPPPTISPPRYVVFYGELVLLRDGEVLFDDAPPSGHSSSAAPTRTLYLGMLEDRPLYAREVPEGGADFVPLRAALIAAGRERLGLLSLASQALHFERTHVFCGRCGGRTDDKPGERAKQCPACGLHAYPRVSPAVIVLVHDGRRMLLAHRPKMPFFALVAGFVESGETLEECVAREVREEVGLEVDDLRYFGSQPWPFPHQIMVGFYARYAGGEIAVDGKELDEARWFDVGELPPLPPPLSIARAMIDAFAQRRADAAR